MDLADEEMIIQVHAFKIRSNKTALTDSFFSLFPSIYSNDYFESTILKFA